MSMRGGYGMVEEWRARNAAISAERMNEVRNTRDARRVGVWWKGGGRNGVR